MTAGLVAITGAAHGIGEALALEAIGWLCLTETKRRLRDFRQGLDQVSALYARATLPVRMISTV